MYQGLTSAEAKANLKLVGYNEIPSIAHKNILKIAIEVFREPMFLLLVSCSVLYVVIGNYHEGVTLLSTVLLIIAITFYQYRKTERSLEALSNLASPRALVLRDDKPIRIPGREVVPDDLLLLNEGDRISADARIIESTNLMVDESLLTGESVAIKKNRKANTVDDECVLYSGTLVVRGKGVAKVFATGVHTNFGKIGVSLKLINTEPTPLQKEMKLLIRNLFFIGIFLSVGVVAAFYFSRHHFINALLNGLSTSMAILPEEFPVILTVFLAIGGWRLSKINVLTRNASAIETLGSTTVLCTDKTGTITQNKMQIAAIYDGVSIVDRSLFNDKKNNIIEIIIAAFLSSDKPTADPMEKAIADLMNEFQIHIGVSLRFIKTYPLDDSFPCMTNVFKYSNESTNYVYTKGAPELVFDLCKLPSDKREAYLGVLNVLAGKGYRVIAVGEARHMNGALPITQTNFDYKFKGLLALEDPIRPEMPAAIKECMDAGIKVIMMTGDFPITARAIGNQIGLPPNLNIITGADVNSMSDTALQYRLQQATIFARVIPSQKLRIVQCLKAQQQIVAMTGDGVNDAPALKAAHIGIAMGNRGTDVAREASSLVLMDDNFASIVSAIRMGRKIYDNLQKTMSYIIAIHIPIIGLTLLPAIFSNIPLLLMPLHIVFLELIIDPICSIAFESQPEEKGIMTRPPRDPSQQFFGKQQLLASVYKGLLLFSMIVVVYFISIREKHTIEEIRTITFSALILGNIVLILSSLSNNTSALSVFKEKNNNALLILLISISVLIAIVTIPAAQATFNFKNPGPSHFVVVFIAISCLLFILEAAKFKMFNRFR